ncbi:zeta toxin family protein [Paludisphaera mucosa]|uniref:Zeta toxin family protein n=1 Tax=Paludisphaera mucosa TaxID=3030827 RepID=A0ABT6F4K3_9BACT|nr:zeta toxin family protein [Paludisphaera mucosa]MDG3002484.1 zeta toxin family protein [Paludisphaera mucosa]
MANAPSVIVLAGPNGAGKSTAAPALLRGRLAVADFVNADEIARGLSAFAPESMAVQAGRIMLARLKHLAAARADFAFETTLATRSFAPWLRSLTATGYEFQLIFLWLPSADLAVARVADRVLQGGHHVPEEVVRRRHAAGLRNFQELYRPLATNWHIYDNTTRNHLRLVARGRGAQVGIIKRPAAWRRFQSQAGGLR